VEGEEEGGEEEEEEDAGGGEGRGAEGREEAEIVDPEGHVEQTVELRGSAGRRRRRRRCGRKHRTAHTRCGGCVHGVGACKQLEVGALKVWPD